MFGFRGGESREIVARKKGYMQEAQEKWPFLTNFDASTVKSEAQLAAMVKDRSGISKEEADRNVRAWTAGKQF